MSKTRRVQGNSAGQHHPIQILLWIVGIVTPIVGASWALFLYRRAEPIPHPVPPSQTEPLVFKAPSIVAPTLTINSFIVGGWDVSISNPNPSMMSISRARLVSPEGAYSAVPTTRNLGPFQVTSMEITAFDEGPNGRSNLEMAKKKLMFMDYETTNCSLEVTVLDVAGEQHSARQDFKCGQIFYMKNPPPPPQ
jgi:hypothetical protein